MKLLPPFLRFYLLTAALLLSGLGFGQTVLTAGDIAFLDFDSDSPDRFSFVFLSNVSSGTLIRFTDNGWRSNNSFRNNEGIFEWTANQNYTCGDIISLPGNIHNLFLSSSGDQILAYQGLPASPNFIAAINFFGSSWQADATNSNSSALPNGLVNGDTALAMTDSNAENGRYNGAIISDTVGNLRVAINNANNWITSSNETDNFTGTITCGNGTTPTIFVSENIISNLNYTENNGPSQEQSFTINGSALTTPIILTAPTNFEISLDANSGYTTSFSLPLSSGSVASTSIYVRLATGLIINSYNGTLTATSAVATQQDIALSGSVTEYCSSSFTDIDDDAITNVTLTNSSSVILLDNDSGDAHVSNINGYEDFTSLTPTDLVQGQTYNLAVSMDSNGDFLYQIFAFFDWDGDLDFDSAFVDDYDLGDNDLTVGDLSTHNIDISIPVGASLGNTRMRIVIMSADFGDPDPAACDPQFNIFGETEDYTINIISASSCNLTNLGLSNITCNNNGTPTDASDDITSFQLNPTGNNLGTTYSVDMDGINISTNVSGPFTNDVITGISYGLTTTFYLEEASAGIGGNLDGFVSDDTDINCLDIVSISDPGSCSPSGSGGALCGVVIDFETAGDYTTSVPEFTDGSFDYFIRTDGSDFSGGVNFTNTDGNFFAAQDIDGEGAILPVELNIINIDISNLTNLEFSIDLAEDDDGSNEDWDEPDYVHIYYTVDGGIEQNLIWIESEVSSGSNGKPRIDTNFDDVGDGAEITDTFTTFTESIAGTGTSMDIRIEFRLDSGDEDIALDNISVCGIDNSIDNDSQVNQPTTQIPAGVIVADETTLFSEALPVFRFEVEDLGTADVLDTTISQFRLVPGTGNTASWSQVIQGVEIVADGGGGQVFDIDQVVSISDTEIIVQIINTPQFEMTTGDGSTRGYTIGVYLNPTGITDQEVIQFAIPNSSSYWTVETNSSQFVTNFTPFEGNLFTIDVVGNGLEFILQPTTTIVNEQMFTVQLANTDTNGNIDLALVNQVIVSSTGTLTGDPISATPQNGIATFNALQHTEVGNGLSLNASSDALSIVSESFDIIIIPELFITEVADPSDNFEGRFIEVFNAGVQEIDFDNSNYFLVRQRASSTEINNIKLTGVIPAKGYFVIGQGAFNYFIDTYGFTPEQLDADAGGTIAGNGDDPYFISLDDTSDIKLKNSAIDIYGVIDVDGTGEVWDYEDNRSYRDNPTIKNANSDWTFNEWTIESAAVDDMTPGYGDNDYIYNGAWNTIGLGNPNSTTTTGAQNIFIRSGSTTLTADTTIGDLVVRAGATLTIDGLLQVTGDIVNEGTIIFNSTATQTAVLGAVASNTRVVGDGFEVRRYFSANRSFRYVSSSVNSTENIQTNWQEGAISATENPISGFGTHITGTLLGTNLGFDATATGNPSMFTWNNATQDWDDLPSTNNTDLEIGIGHAILIRGDRSIDLSTNTPTAVPTTLRSTGSIHIRDFVVPNMPTTEPTLANPIFALIGNPYQAQVDMSVILDNNINSSGMNTNYMYVYDPTIGDRGGYATVTLATGNSTSVPDTSFANQFLQPNQAVFVETTTASPSLTFVESAKLDAFANLQTFSDEASIVPTNLSINLVNSEIQKVVDGVKLNTASENSNEVNYEDALKLWNSSEHFAIRNANQYLSIERREMPQANDSLFFYVGNYQVEEYALQFKNTLPADVEVVLVDQYLNEIHTVNQNESSYPFSVDFNLPESLGSDRFLIIFGSVNLSIEDFSVENNIKIYPNPVSNGSINILLPLEVEVNTSTQISVFDVLGSKIMEQNIHPSNQTIRLDVSSLSTGVYLLEAKQGRNKFTQKMIVE